MVRMSNSHRWFQISAGESGRSKVSEQRRVVLSRSRASPMSCSPIAMRSKVADVGTSAEVRAAWSVDRS
eukprot:3154677-Prymnesium_polylepis.2